MARASKVFEKASHAWRLVVVGLLLALAGQVLREQHEIDELENRLDSLRAASPVPGAQPTSIAGGGIQPKAWEPAQESSTMSPVDMGRSSDDVRRRVQQHYLAGVIYFQKGDYDKAKDEWMLAKQEDPSNEDVASGLERVGAIYAGR